MHQRHPQPELRCVEAGMCDSVANTHHSSLEVKTRRRFQLQMTVCEWQGSKRTATRRPETDRAVAPTTVERQRCTRVCSKTTPQPNLTGPTDGSETAECEPKEQTLCEGRGDRAADQTECHVDSRICHREAATTNTKVTVPKESQVNWRLHPRRTEESRRSKRQHPVPSKTPIPVKPAGTGRG